MMRRWAAWAVTGLFCPLPVTSAADELRGYQHVTVELETSFAEILDVTRCEVPDCPPNANGCLAANLWDEVLPPDFDAARARYVVVR